MKIRKTVVVSGVSILMVAILGMLIAVATRSHENQGIESAAQAQISNDTARPIIFVENQGQWDSKVAYMARKQGMTAWLQNDGITFQFEKHITKNHVQGVTLQMTFENASEWVSLTGEAQQISKHNFLIGNDRSKWQSDVPGYAWVIYHGLYKGIDLRLREDKGWLEYDLLLSEGADLSDVVVCCEGLDGLRIDENGILVMETQFGLITQKSAKAWYETSSGDRVPVACNFRIIDNQRYGFEVAKDLGLALVIDPGLEWSTFLGGNSNECGMAMDINTTGDIVVTGFTESPNFPTTTGVYDTTFNGGTMDGYVSCFSADGSQLLWSTFLGGSNIDVFFDLALDDSDRVIIGGLTNSVDFPFTPGAYDTSHNGYMDGVVICLNAVGSQLVYSTFLGTSGSDMVLALDAVGSGEVVIGGYTDGNDFPATPGTYDMTYNGVQDAFVASLNADGSNLVYSTFLGGSGQEGWVYVYPPQTNTDYMALVRDGSGNVIVGGATASANFPATPGAYDSTSNGSFDSFISKLNATGSDLIFSTYLGSSSDEGVFENAIAVDESGRIVVGGWTAGSNFPTTPGAYDTTFNGGGDAFVSCFDPTGNSLLYSTFIGGAESNPADVVDVLAFDVDGKIVIAGAASLGFPTTPGAYDSTFGGGSHQDGFICRLSPDGNGQADLLYSTFLGGLYTDYCCDMALVADSTAVVVGATYSGGFPTTPGAYDESFNGLSDAFVCRFGVYVGVQEEPMEKPRESIMLSSVLPSPSRGIFSYTINLTQATDVNVYVADVTGRLIETLIDRELPAGHSEFSWRPGENIASGIYFLKLQTGNYSATEKLLLIR